MISPKNCHEQVHFEILKARFRKFIWLFLILGGVFFSTGLITPGLIILIHDKTPIKLVLALQYISSMSTEAFILGISFIVISGFLGLIYSDYYLGIGIQKK